MELGSRIDGSNGFSAPIDDDSSSFHAKLLDSLFDGVYFVDAERKITYWNQGAESLTGYSSREAVGRHCYDNFLVHIDETGGALCTIGCPLTSTIHDGQRREADVFLRHKLGHRVPVCVRVAPITDPARQIVGAVEVFSDISAKKQVERRVHELEGMAFRDGLTGLPNRSYIELKAKQSFEAFQQFQRNFGVMMFDVDHFKQVNDRHGHDAGDLVLKAISDTLAKGLRENDIVGRWGGEEFLALLVDVDACVLRQLAERCRSLVAGSGALSGDSRITATVSVGATLFTQADSIQSAIARSDQLMYVSKSSGRNKITIG
ncbi:MAG TPA: diguanylate cyclase [Candidatus Limnocylindrales bacterium]|nr:diguanylate cyclase [Candidatus Limnocylindrales bacterium]